MQTETPTDHTARRLCRCLLVLLLFIGTFVGEARRAGAAEIGAAETVVRNVYGTSLSMRMKAGERLVANQKVRTKAESAAGIVSLDDTRLSVGPQSEVVLDQFIYDPDRDFAKGAINVVKGVMRFAGSKKKLDVTVKTPSATIGIRGTIVDFYVSSRGTEVSVREGVVEVATARGKQRLSAGQTMTVPNNGKPPAMGQPSAAMRDALGAMTQLLPDSATPIRHAATQPNTGASTAAAAAPTAPIKTATAGNASMTVPRSVLRGKNPENLLALQLKTGLVLIELRPDLSPQHTAWIKQLARENYYDGIAFYNVVAGFAAETGDPTGTGRGGVSTAIGAEPSGATFRRGSVGMKQKRQQPDQATSHFFILLGPAAHLDRRYTYLGDVVAGMNLVDRLHRGQPPKEPSRILELRVAADVIE